MTDWYPNWLDFVGAMVLCLIFGHGIAMITTRLNGW